MQFEKCHGLGNDYIYVRASDLTLERAQELAPQWCHRHTGIGSDGIIILGSMGDGQVSMRMVNADGSEGLICGNGMRGAAWLSKKWDWIKGCHVTLQTKVGERFCKIEDYQSAGGIVTVEMGHPQFGTGAIGVSQEDSIELEGPEGLMTWHPVSMGNPHLVTFVQDPHFDFQSWGPKISSHDFFPGGVNVNFVHQESPLKLASQIWERGSGPTLACGSGACAGFAVARQLNLVGDRAEVKMSLGNLTMNWDEEKGILMTGPIQGIYSGVLT